MIDFDARVNCSVSKAFGEEFLYEHKSGLSYPVTGVFHDGFRRQVFDSDGTPVMATSDPFVGVRMVELRERYGQNDILVRRKPACGIGLQSRSRMVWAGSISN